MLCAPQDELSSSGYKRFLQHQSSQAPMTAREKEMADIKSAEGIEASMQGTSVRHSSINNASGSGAQVGMAWSDEAVNAVGALAKGEKEVVQLGLNTKEEIVILLSAAEQGEALSLPADEPSYTFYKHATGVGESYATVGARK
jgi:twinfilin-like protein